VELYGVPVAERFLGLYRELSGARGELDPTWDLFSLVEVLPEPSVYWGWVNLGVPDLTVSRVRERLDEYATLLASRI